MSTVKAISKEGIRAAIGASVVLAGMFGAAMSAQASDWKGYAGVGCLPQSQNDSIRRSAIGQSAFANMGDSTITVFCPVVRDEWEGGATRVAAVAVRFRNRNASVQGRCEFITFDLTGHPVDSRTALAPFGETTLRMGPLNANNWGSYTLTCQIPGRDPQTNLPSYIVNYRVDEAT
jgi:hypothetical protein